MSSGPGAAAAPYSAGSRVFQVPPPPPPLVIPEQVPEVDETLIRVMRLMKSVDFETFGGTMDCRCLSLEA